jgi:hypothetical protein
VWRTIKKTLPSRLHIGDAARVYKCKKQTHFICLLSVLMMYEDIFSKRPKERLVNRQQKQSRGNKTNDVKPLNRAMSND